MLKQTSIGGGVPITVCAAAPAPAVRDVAPPGAPEPAAATVSCFRAAPPNWKWAPTVTSISHPAPVMKRPPLGWLVHDGLVVTKRNLISDDPLPPPGNGHPALAVYTSKQ